MNIFKSTPKGFIYSFAIFLLVPSICLVLFNTIVDPYGIFNIVRIKGINDAKPVQTSYLRLAKSHVVRVMQPDAAIFGTSRVELAIDPEHPSFKLRGLKPYSMSMAGAGLYELSNNFKHTYYASNGKMKFAIVALDFLMFNANREKVVFETEVFGYDEKRLILSDKDSFIETALIDLNDIFFFKAFRASIKTLKEQNSTELYLKNGMRDQTNNSLAIGLSKEGHKHAFLSNERYYMDKIWTGNPEEKYCAYDLATGTSTFDSLREIVKFAREHDIELHLYLSPTHARKLIAIRESGLWPALEEVKTGIVNIVEEDKLQHGNNKPIAFWDFMDINSITTEPITAQMKWYWEISHYKAATGNLILDRLMNYQTSQSDSHSDFGVLLTKDNLAQQLQKLRNDTISYGIQYPDYQQELTVMAQEVFSNKKCAMCTEAYKKYYHANVMRENGNEQEALQMLQDAAMLQSQEELLAQQLNLQYREKTLRNLIQLSLAGEMMDRPLNSWEDYQKRGNERNSKGDFVRAIEDYTAAIKTAPKNSALHFLRGTNLAQINKHSLAIKDFEVVLELEPQNKTVLELLAKSKDSLASNNG